jgi:methionyl-tRNA formyltransferase
VKIGYFADGPWSHRTIEQLVGLRDIEIMFITPRIEAPDPVLRDWAERLDVPFLPHADVNSREFREMIAVLGCDLMVSMSFNQILKRDLIDLPRLGFINCHAGALPFYRGRNPLNWVLINGESEFGITVHYVDEGIDTGDIIRQRKYPITPQDTYGTLLTRAIRECANVLVAAVSDIRDGSVSRTPQASIHPVGTYFGRRKAGDERMNWHQSSERCVNFIRGITLPGPCARTWVRGNEVGIVEATLIDGAPNYIATVGEVVGRSPAGAVVKTATSSILVNAVAEVDAGQCGTPHLPRWKVGTRLA